MKKSDLIFSVIVLATATSFAFANAYKWENKDNQVEYSQVPPPNTEATEITPPPPPSSSAPTEIKQMQNLNEKLNKQEEKAAEEKAKQAKEAAINKDKQYNCDLAKKHLADMESKARIRLLDNKGGALQMSQEQRAEEIQKTKDAIEQYCGTKKPAQ